MITVPIWLLVALAIQASLFALAFIFAIIDFIVTIVQERKYK